MCFVNSIVNMEDSTWKQMERTISKNGFLEGAGEGRESSFQNGFDIGYAEGYRIGRLLGQSYGKQRFSEVKDAPKEAKSQLELESNDPRRGDCLICKGTKQVTPKSALPDAVYEKTFEEIQVTQKSHNDAIVTKLVNK